MSQGVGEAGGLATAALAIAGCGGAKDLHIPKQQILRPRKTSRPRDDTSKDVSGCTLRMPAGAMRRQIISLGRAILGKNSGTAGIIRIFICFLEKLCCALDSSVGEVWSAVSSCRECARKKTLPASTLFSLPPRTSEGPVLKSPAALRCWTPAISRNCRPATCSSVARAATTPKRSTRLCAKMAGRDTGSTPLPRCA